MSEQYLNNWALSFAYVFCILNDKVWIIIIIIKSVLKKVGTN